MVSEPVIRSDRPHGARFAGFLVLSIGLVFAAMAAYMANGLLNGYRLADAWDGKTGVDPLEDISASWILTGFSSFIALGTLALALFLLTRSRANRPGAEFSPAASETTISS